MDIDIKNLSPMMQNYIQTKEEYKDCILFYRLGDFYEMFFDDALLASKELELTLTGKNCGLLERAPMCGVPFHAAENYINKLVAKGYKVAICEQVEDPKLAKGLVKREVIRVATPGTNIDVASLDESRNNYIMSIVYVLGNFGFAISDVTTGVFYVTEVNTLQKLTDEIYKFNPSEIICNESFLLSGINIEELRTKLSVTLYSLESWYFDDTACEDILKSHFKVTNLSGLGLHDLNCGKVAAGSLLKYLYETQKNSLEHILSITPYNISDFMLIDSSTRRNLELTETMRDKNKRGSLLWVLDKCKTAMGSRMIRSFIEQPLINKERITLRLDAVEALFKNAITREELREYLSPIYDLERLMSKISYKSANPRDLIALRNSLKLLPAIKQQLSDFKSGILGELYDKLDDLNDIFLLIENSINEEAPITIKEGGIIKEGYNETIDNLRNAKVLGKKWLTELEASDKERTGIKNLRIKYNRVFGYYFEVTNSFKELVPDDYVRKQTLANCERFITQELKDLEAKVLGAQDRIVKLEYEVFDDIRKRTGAELARVQRTAAAVAQLDVLCSFAQAALENNYVCPQMSAEPVIKINEGRHPVVEKMLNGEPFVPNDTVLDCADDRCAIITGPNMAGKSTYMRQVALVCVMAQAGSFVPAASAELGIVDSVFTRIGASDDLSAGQSTFMVEMSEVASILNNATSRSLIIFDEIGRGTSTFDGMSIARAVLEYAADKKRIGAKTLFATHYHELTELEGQIDGVKNYNIAVKKRGDDITFLRRIVRGGADGSYGIEVAKLAGVPKPVVERAKKVLKELEESGLVLVRDREPSTAVEPDAGQISFGQNSSNEIVEKLKVLDVNTLTPIEAMGVLYELTKSAKEI